VQPLLRAGPMSTRMLAGTWIVGAMALFAVRCAPASKVPLSTEPTNNQGGALSGCNGTASSSIPASGDYYLTTFGGPSEPQPLACGGNSDSGNWYYAASSQRYGCGVHLQVEANGKCVVAEAEDYGPDICVENAAGGPILDASPLVGQALFGESDLGWSDRAPIHVTVVDSSVPLGVCATGSSSSSSSGSSSSTTSSGSGSGTTSSSSSGSGAGGSGAGSGSGAGGGGSGSGAGGAGGGGGGGGGGSGISCSGDGDCNPGNDGSGMICVGGQCVAGCHSDAQCPGITTCVGGQCQ
jgi:hypothetical protein